MAQRHASDKQLEAKRTMGRRLRELRTQAELSMAELANRISARIEGPLNRQAIYDWEWTDEKEARGVRPIGIPGGMITDVAAALGVEVDALTGGATPTNNPHVLAVERLTKKLSAWRLQELSTVPADPLRKGVDAIIAEHKDSPAGARQRRRSQRD